MGTAHIDDFYFVTAEVLCRLYAAFPVRHLLLVEDITGPIAWDLTGLPDRKSRATFESFIWLADEGLLRYRSLEPRDVGVEGAVLTQHAFALLAGRVTWQDGAVTSRIEALLKARRERAYDDLGVLINDLLWVNGRWQAPAATEPLPRGPSMLIREEPLSEH